jgi:hypothetical protein
MLQLLAILTDTKKIATVGMEYIGVFEFNPQDVAFGYWHDNFQSLHSMVLARISHHPATLSCRGGRQAGESV